MQNKFKAYAMELQIKIPEGSRLESVIMDYHYYRRVMFNKKAKATAKKCIQHAHWMVGRHLRAYGIDWEHWNIVTVHQRAIDTPIFYIEENKS